MILLFAVAYFLLLIAVSWMTARKTTNDIFYRGERRSPWWAVAFGMLGASLSGVTFVSVPGMVLTTQMTYLQMCLGFVPGYIAVAFILLPVYYSLGLTSIYTYLSRRFGERAYTTGASFFLLSKLTGAAVRLYIVCIILHHTLLASIDIPFAATATLLLLLIWLYTRRGGIGTIVWTDCLQTGALLLALVLIIGELLMAEGWTVAEAVRQIAASPMSRVFETDDWSSRQHFLKQFLSGFFIVIVMTGLDQDMMQKNLTCRTLRQSQKNMVTNGLLYVPANLLFLSLGVLMYMYASHHQIEIPQRGDDVLPFLCAGGYLGKAALYSFALGIVAAAFSSADSAMTALTTSVCIDILHRPSDVALRRWVHLSVAVCILLFILAFHALGSNSVIDAVYLIASYTYGPLLGLFSFGLFTQRDIIERHSRLIPPICVASPVLCWLLSVYAKASWGYTFGYELLMLNGGLTFLGLWFISKKRAAPCTPFG